MEISEPSILAKVPRPQTENGRVFYTQVYSFSNGLRRKRQEVCVAVDGDSINVYEVQNGRSLSSCPIPLDSTLCCSPYSICSKTEAGKKIRSIYYATKRRNEINLSMFRKEDDGTVRRPLMKTVSTQSSKTPIVQLEVLPMLNTHQVLALREDGHFEIYDQILSSQILRGRLSDLAQETHFIAAQWHSLAEAQKSILKARPDIVAVSDNGSSFITGVLSVSSSEASGQTSSLELGVWRLTGTNSSSINDTVTERVLHYRLPVSSTLVSRDRDPVTFASRDTKLVINTQLKLYTFDLTSPIPQMIQETPLIATNQLSSIFITDKLTLFSTSDSLQLHNTRFRTIQTRLDLDKTNLKRKRTPALGGPIKLVTYFPGLGRIVASRRDHLLAIDLRILDGAAFATAAGQTSLLINNIGRGVSNTDRLKTIDHPNKSAVGHSGSQSDALDHWQTLVKQLDVCLQDKNYVKFESMYLENIGDNEVRVTKESSTLTGCKVDYLISKMFEYETKSDDSSEPSERALKTVFVSQKLLDLLIIKGLLTIERVGRVLKANSRSNSEQLKHGNISQILVENEPSLRLLHKYLTESPYVPHQELCAAILLLLRRALAESSNNSLLTTAEVPTATTEELEIVNSTSSPVEPTKGVSTNTAACLCAGIERMTETSSKLSSKLIRQTFKPGEIVVLVQFLRQQLFRSGYTRSFQTYSYPSPAPSENGVLVETKMPHTRDPEMTLGAIASTLSSCIDAIGPMGVLSFGDEEDFVQTLITELSSEVAKATEALQDATFLEGFLREYLRFTESTSRMQEQSETSVTKPGDAQTKSGTIITLFTELATDTKYDENSSMIPLGLQAEGKLKASKVRKGDGRVSKRSGREMGILQDRQRGPYALERLVL